MARTPYELSVVCEQGVVPEGVVRDDGWRCLKVESPFDFDFAGVVSSMAARLAQEGTKMFAVATWDSDYLMVKQHDLEATIATLEEGTPHRALAGEPRSATRGAAESADTANGAGVLIRKA